MFFSIFAEYFISIFNMETIRIKDKTFKPFITEAQLMEKIKAVAERLNKDMAGKNPLLLAVLNGSFMFAADLMRCLTIPCEISFIKIASYQGTSSTGQIQDVIGINQDLTDRTIIIVEDIVESGLTMKHTLDLLKSHNPKSIHICTLFQKPELLKTDIKIDYVAIPIPNDFIVGYGLDYDQQGRQLRDIYTLVTEKA